MWTSPYQGHPTPRSVEQVQGALSPLGGHACTAARPWQGHRHAQDRRVPSPLRGAHGGVQAPPFPQHLPWRMSCEDSRLGRYALHMRESRHVPVGGRRIGPCPYTSQCRRTSPRPRYSHAGGHCLSRGGPDASLPVPCVCGSSPVVPGGCSVGRDRSVRGR